MRFSTPLLLVALATPVFSTACKMGDVKVPEGANVTWAEMDKGQRMAHMGGFVEPRMKVLFRSFDPKRFKEFGCKTCHGAGAADQTYAMPNPDLPRISTGGFYKKHRKQHAEITEFMWKTVESNVADAIGETYASAGHINCASCHIEED